MWAALEVGRDLGPDDVVVVLLPDSGRGYLSKLYNDGWMADHGFLPGRRRDGRRGPGVERPGPCPPLVHVHPDETVRAAIAVLQEFGVSQMPVVKAEPPLALAEVVGSVTDRDLLERAFHDPGDRSTSPSATVMEPPLPTIGHGRDGRRWRRPGLQDAPGRARARRRPPGRHPDPLRPAGLPGPAHDRTSSTR